MPDIFWYFLDKYLHPCYWIFVSEDTFGFFFPSPICFVYFLFFFCSEFCHTLKWNSHVFTCVPHPNAPSHLPLHPLPLGLPSAPGPKIHLVLFPLAHSFSVLDVGRTRKTCADLLNDIKMKMALSSSEWTSSHLFYVSLTFMLFSCMTCHEWVVRF